MLNLLLEIGIQICINDCNYLKIQSQQPTLIVNPLWMDDG
jgi:hypothetical protein